MEVNDNRTVKTECIMVIIDMLVKGAFKDPLIINYCLHARSTYVIVNPSAALTFKIRHIQISPIGLVLKAGPNEWLFTQEDQEWIDTRHKCAQ